MFRRLFMAPVLAVVVLGLVAPALAAEVNVRVEGLNRTIFGKTEPKVKVYEGALRATDGSVHALSKPTALGALEAASRKGEFAYRLKAFSFGLFVDRIGRFPAAGSSGWVFKVNGVSPNVGAADVVLEEGDVVLWYYAIFGPAGGPKTLDLVRRPDGCYRALELDDAGKAKRARNVVFKLNHRAVKSKSGEICSVGQMRTLRATKAGAIRSELVRPS